MLSRRRQLARAACRPPFSLVGERVGVDEVTALCSYFRIVMICLNMSASVVQLSVIALGPAFPGVFCIGVSGRGRGLRSVHMVSGGQVIQGWSSTSA